jgi:hypothetical protein
MACKVALISKSHCRRDLRRRQLRVAKHQLQETAQVEDSHPRWFVQPSANCRNLGVASAMAELSFQQLTIGASIAI